MKNTVATIQQQKENNDKITMLTAYDYSMAKLMDESGINMSLVGDSPRHGNARRCKEYPIRHHGGYDSSHCGSIAGEPSEAMVVADTPFMSYQTSVDDALTNAGRLMKEGRCSAVKLEGGLCVCPQIKAITEASIPVVAHLGLTSLQFLSTLSADLRFRENQKKRPKKILDEASAVEEAGRFCSGSGMCARKISGEHLKIYIYSHYRYRSWSRLRRSGPRISGHACVVF